MLTEKLGDVHSEEVAVSRENNAFRNEEVNQLNALKHSPLKRDEAQLDYLPVKRH